MDLLRMARGLWIEVGGGGDDGQDRLVALDVACPIKGVKLTRISELTRKGRILLRLCHSLRELIEAQRPLLLRKFSKADCVIWWCWMLEAHVAFWSTMVRGDPRRLLFLNIVVFSRLEMHGIASDLLAEASWRVALWLRRCQIAGHLIDVLQAG